MTAPAPSAAEQAVIDRFGIFDEERIVEEVARAMYDSDTEAHALSTNYTWDSEADSIASSYRRLAAAAITTYRTQDGGAEA